RRKGWVTGSSWAARAFDVLAAHAARAQRVGTHEPGNRFLASRSDGRRQKGNPTRVRREPEEEGEPPVGGCDRPSPSPRRSTGSEPSGHRTRRRVRRPGREAKSRGPIFSPGGVGAAPIAPEP